MIGLLTVLIGLLSMEGDMNSYTSYLPHAVYIATIQLEEVAGNSPDRLLCRVFQDDLKDAMRLSYGKAEALSDHYGEMKENLQEYINDRIRLDINQEKLPLNIETVEKINDIYEVCFSFHIEGSWQEVEMDVKLLTEIFPDQTNIVIIKGLTKSLSFRCNRKTTQISGQL